MPRSQLRWVATAVYQRLAQQQSCGSSSSNRASQGVVHQAVSSLAGIHCRQQAAPGFVPEAFRTLHTSAAASSSANEPLSISPLMAVPDIPVALEEQKQRVRQGTRLDAGLCKQQNLKISPKKLNLICKLVRRLHIDEALAQCQIATQRGAVYVKEALMKARGDAIKKQLDYDKLVVDEIWVTKGFVSKRPWFHGRGKVGLRTKFYSHLSVVLRPRQDFVPWMKAVDAMQVRERKQRKYPYATPGMLKAVRRKVLAEGSGTGATSA